MDDVKYFAMLGSQRVGPMTLDELKTIGLTPVTPVWRTGMADWAQASTLPELASCFGPAPSYPPYNGSYPYGNQSARTDYGNTPGNGYYNPQESGQMPQRPDTYLVWSIVVTVLCCLVGGIVALVYSSKVNSCYDRGDYEGALSASNSARTWCIISAVVGFVSSMAYVGMTAFGLLGNLL